MKRNENRNKTSESGVALVTTIIVVAVLAIITVSFMQSTSIDKITSRSVINYSQAKLATESGLATANTMLTSQMGNDHFIIVSNPERQLFSGIGSNQPVGTFAYRPLFSFTTSLSNLVSTATNSSNTVFTSGQPTTNIAAGPNVTNFIFSNVGGLSITSPPALSWIYTTNQSGKTNARFAFWVEDLGGKLNLSVVGVANASDPSARRPRGDNPAEIALWSIFSPASPSDPGNFVSTSLASARSNIFTASTARLINPQVTQESLNDLTAGLIHNTNEVDTIPFGLGYSGQDQGKPKFNINTNLTPSGGGEIVQIIQRNLPNFATQRAGGREGLEYLNHLAANIVDYGDSNPSPTTISGQRGNEPAVYLNEVFDRYFWSENLNVNGAWSIKIQISTYMEFWNPTDKQIQGNIKTEIDARQIQAKINGIDRPIATDPWVYEGNIDFRPNEYKVIEMSREVTLPWGPTEPPKDARITLSEAEVNYSISLNGDEIDKSTPGQGLERVASTEGMAFQKPYWKGNPMVADVNLELGRAGDPRINKLINLKRKEYKYENHTSWGGRNRMPELPTTPLGEVKRWLDGTFITNSPAGATATTVNDLPSTLSTQIAYYPHAPIRFNNSGRINNILELGHIFDPTQWNVNLNSLDNISQSASPSNLSGGTGSLRVGRAEHSRFTNQGLRASQLLDLFAAGQTNNAGFVRNSISGRININTASTNALRALAAGVFHQSDPAINPTNLVVPTNAVRAFVEAVDRFRNERPFFSTSQLTMLATNNNTSQWPSNAVFGNKTLIGANEWNDSAAEEWYSKIYHLSTVRSRNFMVYMVGQALQPTDPTKPSSTLQAAYQIYVEPIRNQQGITTNARTRVLKSWAL